MLIKVKYMNGQEDEVEDFQLDDLIKNKEIKQFLRSDGWCTIGVDQIRSEKRAHYQGTDRRKYV